jgi:hypothetical protein
MNELHLKCDECINMIEIKENEKKELKLKYDELENKYNNINDKNIDNINEM